jgi:hypothetical protein
VLVLQLPVGGIWQWQEGIPWVLVVVLFQLLLLLAGRLPEVGQLVLEEGHQQQRRQKLGQVVGQEQQVVQTAMVIRLDVRKTKS